MIRGLEAWEDKSEETGILEPEVRSFPKMRAEAFHGLPGFITGKIGPHTEGDLKAILLNLHAFFGNAIGRGPHYRVEGTDHGPNLFVLQVGDSAKARKGTAADRIKQIFRLVDWDWATKRLHNGGLSSGEGVIWEVRDPVTKMVREGKGDAATTSEEEIDHGIDDKRLMVLESEFAGVLCAMQRQGNTLSRVLRDGWDRGDLATLVKNSPARATGACISIVGHITSPEIREHLDRTDMASGFANRFLFACVRRSKILPFGGSLTDDAIQGLATSVSEAVDRAKLIARVTMTDAAKRGWEKIYPKLSEDRPGLLGALTARAEAQTIRLALIYALWDGSSQIGIEHLTAAQAVWEFCYDSVNYIFGDTLGDVVADTILGALKIATEGLTRTEISALFLRNVVSSQITRALTELSRRGLADYRRSPQPAGGAGRPVETWFYTGDKPRASEDISSFNSFNSSLQTQ